MFLYADVECLIKKIDRSKNNPKNPFTTKEGENIPSVFQSLQYHQLKETKRSMMYADVKITWKSLVNLEESMQLR